MALCRRYIFYFLERTPMKKEHVKGRNTLPITKRRVLMTSVAFLLFTVYLIYNLIKLQVFGYDYYKEKVYDQITTTSSLRANRGNIYDSSMSLLATTNTTWRIFISTKDIKLAEKESGYDYSELIASGLSYILNIHKETLKEKIIGTNVLDVTIEKSATEKEYTDILNFIKKNSLERLVFTEAQSSRYYPNGTLLAHVLGFCGSDNQGLYGLEYYYDSALKGKDGYYLYAKDANGNALDTEYSTYVPTEDGNSIITTIDSYIQAELEGQLETILKKHSVQNRVTGIVMDTNTGAILAMATSSPFDPNSPYELDEISAQKLAEKGYDKNSEEYKTYKRELMEIMWSNKAISETYEPGSTFKIVTVSAALDSGFAKMTDTFSCVGFYEVGGWHIKCHKITGHGSGFSLSYGLQMSCNPTMMQIAERMGSETFYNYAEKFGYFEKTGIDLPSEAKTIFHKLENIGSTELATAAFGQRFKVTIINQLTAIAAVANGGKLVTPYVVDKIVDSSGKVISEHTIEVKRTVISKEVAEEIAASLEAGVSGDGGAKNAYVEGYKVAAKTGTSQKFDVLDANGNSYLRIGSTVAFAPSDESGIAAIIVVDEPTSTVKYGSVVAAPYISNLFTKILPYLEYESNEEKINIKVENYVGMPIDAAVDKIKKLGLGYTVIGDGKTVIRQTPNKDNKITSRNSTIILYTTDSEEYVTVPKLVGLNINDAATLAINIGLNISVCGYFGVVTEQSFPVGAIVRRGEVIKLKTLILDYED